jgi:histidinol-phosphate aminotransferase
VTPYKLSSNENPLPPLPGVLEAAQAVLERLNRYPDMGNTALYDALAATFDVCPDMVTAGTGSTALLYGAVQAFCEPGDEVVYPWRSFEAYPIAVGVGAATAVPVPLTPTGEHDLAAMAAAVTDRTRIVTVCTPNNPTGPALTRTALEEFVGQIPPNVLILIDEAYWEFTRIADPVDGVDFVRRHPNVVAMRSFAKAHGLAGLRVGYLVASSEITAAMRAVALPFGVNAIAQAAAVASLERLDEVLARVDQIVGERERVLAALRDQGWTVPDAQGNFVWLGVGDRAMAMAQAADAVGLTLRPFAGDGVRITIGEVEGNDRFLELAAGFVDPA